MIGQTRIVELNPADRETALRIQRGIDNILIRSRGLLEQLAETASRNEGLIISSEQFRHIEVLSDGNLRIAY